MWVVARWAGPTVWGTVSWAMAFATAVLIVAKFGLELGCSRLASEYGVSRPGTLRVLLAIALGLRTAFTLPVAAATLIFAGQIAAWFNDPGLVVPIRLAAGIIVCASFYEFKEQFLIGLNRHATVSKIRSLTLASRIVLTIVVVLAGIGAAGILAGYCAAWVVGVVVFFVLLYRRLPATADPIEPATLARRLMALSLPLAISSASVTIYSQTDKLMLGFFDGVDEVGHYAVARAVSEVSLFPTFAVVMTLRPALASRFSSGALDECAALIRKSLRLLLAIGVLFGSVFAVLAVPLITFVVSQDFRYAGELMSVFLWVIVLKSLGAMVLPALVAAERTRLYAYLTASTAVVNFFLNLVLIPKFEAWGAVVATIVSYGLLLVFGLREVFKIFGVRLEKRAYLVAIRTVLAGVVAGIVLWLILGQIQGGPLEKGAWVLVWACLLVAVYFALLILFKVVLPADVRQIWKSLRN